jgi:hypothetical protein
MKKAVAILAAGFALVAAPTYAAVTFDYIFDGGFPLSVSNDGSVVAGTMNDGSYTGFRWTQATGLVSLGRPQTGGGGGVPGISADGTRIAYGIGSVDGTYRTQGRWTLGSGWQELMPPTPPGRRHPGRELWSAYDISGDGNTVSASTIDRHTAIGPTLRSGRKPPASSTWAERPPARRAVPIASTTMAP